MTEPLVSVIMATWGRGRHILPSVQSVLRQGFREFELIVVGDACTDETEAVVAGIDDPRVRWINLTERCGSQAAPNNAGIAAARGQVIAYLGHDDIWEPDHLSLVAKLLQSERTPDFAVSGLISHLPNGLQGSTVMGIFREESAKLRHFFPPSSIAHRREVVDRIGPWSMPAEVRAPVDEDFIMRAVAAQLRFASTEVVTVHKFAAGHRYLSYVRQDALEQEVMLADLDQPGHAARIASIISESRRAGQFMVESKRDYSRFQPGELARRNAARRGLLRPELRPLGEGVILRQKPDLCALDWHGRPVFGTRLHKDNPRPRLLVPFSADGPVRLRLRVTHPFRAALERLDLCCNDVPATLWPGGLRPGLLGWTACVEARIILAPDRPSILEFRLTETQRQKRRIGPIEIGFGIGPLQLMASAFAAGI